MLYAVSILLTLGIFILDLQTPLGSGEWLFYFFPLLIVSRTPRIRSVSIFTAVVTVLMALGYLLSPGLPQIHPAVALRNRLLAACVFWVTAVILVQRRQALEKLNRAREDLEERVGERTAELARAGKAFQESEERLRIAKRAARLGIHDHDVASGTIRWDKRFRELWGVGPEEPITYETFMSGLHPDDRAPTQAAVDWALDPSRGGEYCAEYRVISRADGRERWVAATGQVVFKEGRAVRFVGTVQEISASKKAEAELRKSEERFRTSVETMLDGFAIFSAIRDKAGRIVDFRYDYINEAGCRMNGRSREETLGRRYTELFPAIKENDWFKDFVRTVETGEPLVREAYVYSGVFAGGEPLSRTFDLRAVKMGDGLAASWMDVTEHRRMEEELRRRAEELETVLQSVPAVVWIAHDPACLHITGNRVADELLRLPHGGEASLTAPEGERPTHFKVMKDGRELSGEELAVQRAARGEVVADFENSVAFDDGTVRHMLGNAMPLYDAQGRPRGSVSAFVDITERKVAEEALRRSHEELEEKVRERTEELRETTRALEELIQAAPVGITVLDPEGKVTLWNPTMERIYGWTEGEVRGKLPPAVTEAQEGAQESLERLLAGQRFAGVELRRFRKDGQPVDLLLWTAPLQEESGRLKSTIVILLDVTHLKELERMALSQQKMASLGQVAAGIAHEIRNPLSGINLYLHSLETFLGDAEISDPEIREQTEAVIVSMKAASTKMESVIQRVLAFSRTGLPKMGPLNVNICIREAVGMARVSLQKAGARVAVALQEDLPLCRGDMRLIEQALLNLIINAGQAMEKQEGERVIEISSSLVCFNPGRSYHVTLSVADSGPGIPETVRERIFDPFFTTKQEGTGIGLSITRKIVSDHGGFIMVGTSQWGGALFTIGLPADDRGEISAA